LKNLAAAVDAAPHHLSVYDLQIEKGTRFAKKYRPGEAPLPLEETAAAMYAAASATLRGAGYEHYEVSNYAKEGKRCVHNMAYWEGVQYYAFGLGAASYLGGRRFSRPRHMASYKAWVEELASAGKPVLPAAAQAPEPPQEQLLDDIMLRLRLSDGLDLKWLATKHKGGVDAAKAAVDITVERVQRGQAVVVRDDTSGDPVLLRLTDPEGFLVSNDIISDIFAEVERREKG
jgi:coproporphyrinogen III oxidase-like Fe-S oxidoreductase